MSIKAILLDIDGTLTNDKKIITDKTKKALMKAQENGIKLVIASGRPSKGIYKYGNQLEMENNHGLFVCFNGAKVIDCQSLQTYVDVAIDTNTCKDVLEHLKQFDVIPVLYNEEYMLVEDVYKCDVLDGDRKFNVIEYEARMNGFKLMEVDSLKAYVNTPQNKILTAGDSEYLKKVYQDMSKPFIDKLSMMFTANFYYEYTAKGIDKGNALKIVLDKLNIKPEECIAFGDAQNDIPMLKLAGIGVAMENGQEEVKKIADEITLDNNHDGIALSLEKHLPFLK